MVRKLAFPRADYQSLGAACQVPPCRPSCVQYRDLTFQDDLLHPIPLHSWHMSFHVGDFVVCHTCIQNTESFQASVILERKSIPPSTE